ncbi:MAG: metallophosphoesterase family protein [bacterium]
MKYAIISDIHGNLEALESVLDEIERQSVDSVLCLGDVVGYGPNPNECVELVRQRAQVILAGNHDYAPIGKLDISYFNPWARTAIEWTRGKLLDSSVEFLLSLPLKLEVDGFTIVHSTPNQPEEWNYIITIGDAVKNFPEFQSQVCFIGHSHVPMVISLDEKDSCRVVKENPLRLEDGLRYIINVGSVGQPRDLNPRSSFGIFNCVENVFELFRVEYDIAETQRKIRASSLPDFLAERLEIGQ